MEASLTSSGTSADNKSAQLLGIGVGSGTLERIMNRSLAAIDGAAPQCTFACANPNAIVVAQRDPAFKRALNSATLCVADGVGVTIVGRLLGLDVGPRVTGHDYFEAVLNALHRRGRGRVFFFGSSQRVLDLIAERFNREYPTLTLCGLLSPPYRDFSDAEDREFIARINATNADVLWVGMTAPKQESWVDKHIGSLGTPVVGSIGAVFEFYARTTERAPEWLCTLGLEWAYRLMREPRRMWRRTFVMGPRFLLECFRQHVLRS